ncbi:hypothetical protein M378DRAFT_160680 [Amanita muscaria Koide BX008]|uniref:MARVEL domain-containing protein n=1 Tax=Amanita muscaria (strain Koide BX008) TaxID=946122 RepID=A0A0C2WXX7_AMAMK|nr:hypothetical protein M378DRAFT_160680 [Amanita muscaria Koide BX008]
MPHYLTKMIPRRWPSYVITLACAVCQTCVALNAPAYDALNLSTFGILAIFTSLWIGILLCYGRSETEFEHTLTRCYTHITSFALIAVLWFGLGVLFAIHAEIECHRHTSDCMSLWVSTVLAFLTFLSSCICVAIVMCPVAVAGGGYNTHVEDARKRARNITLDRQESETGDPHIELPNAHNMALVSRPPPTHIF